MITICYNYVVELFNIPDDLLVINLNLVDNVDFSNSTIPIDYMEIDDFEIDDVRKALSLKKEVYKRRLLDALCVGGGMSMSSTFENYEEEINKLNPELCDLYKKIILLNEYLLFVENIDITDEDKKQISSKSSVLRIFVEILLLNPQNIWFLRIF